MVDVARRLCEDNQIHVNEIWSYHAVGDDVRFTLVHEIATRHLPPGEPRPRCGAHPAQGCRVVETGRARKQGSKRKAGRKSARPQKRK